MQTFPKGVPFANALIVPAVLAVALATQAGAAPPKPDPQMTAVLKQLAAFHAPPLQTLTPQQARKQPGPPDAVKALLKKRGMSTAPMPVGSVKDVMVPGAAGQIPARVYTPEGDGPFPVMVYFHGGGFVIANINAYDSSCRALCSDAKCVVVSVGYRQAPEHKLPAAQEDSYAATQYIMSHTDKFGGDPKRVAKDRKGKMPIYQMLVYPVTNNNTNTPSYLQNANAKPLSKPLMKWFFHYILAKPSDGMNPYITPMHARNLHGLPPATIVAAEIDPLRSEGKSYADRLKANGIPVRYRLYTGVTHEFFGMAAVVDKAKQANAFAAEGLTGAFTK